MDALCLYPKSEREYFMKVTNEKLLTAAVYSRSISGKQFPSCMAYIISRNFDKIDSALQNYDKIRSKQMEQYTEKDEKGKIKTCKDENTVIFKNDKAKADWKKEVKALNDTETDVDIRKLKIGDFGDARFSVDELRAIDFMLDEE